MLLPSFFILDFKKAENLPDICLPENAFFCFRITNDFFSSQSSFIKTMLLANKKNKFCLLIDIDIPESDFKNIIDSSVSCTFFYNYLKVDYDNPLLIFETANGENLQYNALAQEIFKSHGYSKTETILVNKKSTNAINKEKNICFNFIKNKSNLLSEYKNSIKEISSAESSVFFYLNEADDLPEISDTIMRSEILMQKEFPQIYNLLEENRIIKKKEQELLFKIGLQQEQLESANNYFLSDSSETQHKKQIKEIVRFYNNEYEILPNWYKRFGHIIKVIMGKRSFKSLFNDNVKKYKN